MGLEFVIGVGGFRWEPPASAGAGLQSSEKACHVRWALALGLRHVKGTASAVP